jgi:enamine deaminase RidA (YjgF/YER057c/UK114 family)
MRRIRLAGQLPEPISHYTDGVEAGGFLYVSGMLPVGANGDLVGAGDVVRQAEQVLDNVGTVLRAAGATFDDVVRVGVYLLNVATGRPSTRCAAATSAMPGQRARWWRSARSPSPTHW